MKKKNKIFYCESVYCGNNCFRERINVQSLDRKSGSNIFSLST